MPLSEQNKWRKPNAFLNNATVYFRLMLLNVTPHPKGISVESYKASMHCINYALVFFLCHYSPYLSLCIEVS
jgi:hypothetical protein